jgi:hypothetical protein
MRTFRLLAFWVVALIGAVKIHDPLGVPGLVAWTAGALAFSHSRHWHGAFPEDDPGDDHRFS